MDRDEKKKKIREHFGERESERRRRIEQKRQERKKERQRQAFKMRAILAGVVALVLILITVLAVNGLKKSPEEEEALKAQALKEEQEKQRKLDHKIAKIDRLAAMYDYDEAIERLNALAEEGENVQGQIAEYKKEKGKLVEADVDKIPHIFFHTLVADPSITWNLPEEDAYKLGDYNQVMTTVDEFKAILQQMYDRGYVLVRLHDLVKETENEDGETVFTKGKILLPKGKKPFVMSQDDVSYYFSMQGDGYASRMVVGADGRPTTEYIDTDGNTVTGAYDLVPVLNEFIDEHPDFSYRGAKAVLAFTGYNGILGYRTDPDLAKTADEGNEYAQEYGTFDYKAEIEAVKPVIESLKKDGWELASHSYGHISYGSSLKTVKEDADKWQERVGSIIGPTDIITFPFGSDIGGWSEYEDSNEAYRYLYDQGFRFFCNADSNPYWVQITDEYVRQGRRNVDGYRMYQDLYNGMSKLSDLFDVSEVFDENRPAAGLQEPEEGESEKLETDGSESDETESEETE